MNDIEDLRWRKLNALDAKTSALLRLSGIIMSVTAISVFYGTTQPWMVSWIRALFASFLLSCFLCVTTLWVTWTLTERLIYVRTWCCRLALVATSAGLFCLAYLVYRVQYVG